MKPWHGDDIAEEDIVLEAENNEPPKGGDAEKKVAKLKADLAAALEEKQANLDGWQRAKADYVNLLKRGEEASKAAEEKGKLKAVETLLPAFDALERAKDLPAGRQGMDEVVKGFLAITKQLESAFAALGLEEVGQVGEEFNPALHEAFGQDKAEKSDDDGKITAVLERGWRIGERVIRAAKVRVASA